ncbi:MAG: aspartate-semialdehyde dehydrogenase [Limnochordales bacterium]|nr:MAG: aspartate-semialdehyde dehydrogenase [Bacillota bacterium]
MKLLNIAVLGATGAVGAELLQLLRERNFPVGELRLLASPRSAGKTVRFGEEDVVVQAVSEEAFRGVDVAFFSAGGSVSRQWVRAAVEAGAVVIDNTSAFRLDPDVPLVVPEVNPDAALRHHGVIANPNCSTIIMLVALNPLYREAGIERIVVSTYQAVSGAGAAAMQELLRQVEDYQSGKPLTARRLPVAGQPRHYPILFNVIPQVDVFDDDGYTKEEWKMVRETRKVWDDDTVGVSATTVRVPVLRSHAESINVQTRAPLTPERARELLAAAPGVAVVDEPEAQRYPMPLDASGKDEVFVGRIRKDPSIERGLNLWVVGDQIRKGAALNALQIAELLAERGRPR